MKPERHARTLDKIMPENSIQFARSFDIMIKLTTHFPFARRLKIENPKSPDLPSRSEGRQAISRRMILDGLDKFSSLFVDTLCKP
jgi:hypothetical protein